MELIQITAGKGPLECSYVVGKVYKMIVEDGKQIGVDLSIVSKDEDVRKGCYRSLIVSFSGDDDQVNHFLKGWCGSIKYVMKSPFRAKHRRKNWFISVNRLEERSVEEIDRKDILFETTRSSGPGGQHINKTESAVRAIHKPTNISVVISSERSQYRNKAIAFTVLKSKIEEINRGEAEKGKRSEWDNHHLVERGNPIRIFKG